MLIIETPAALQEEISRLRRKNLRIALVPTMGNLHDGHLRLIATARAHADIVVASIFVNPMQFDKPEDLSRYPRTFREDSEKLEQHRTDILFVPGVSAIYPQGTDDQTFVEVPGLSGLLEGASRPGHFRGSPPLSVSSLIWYARMSPVLARKIFSSYSSSVKWSPIWVTR